MATRLPAINFIQPFKAGDKPEKERSGDAAKRARARRREKTVAFLASVQLGSLQRQPRPGDVFRSAPRSGPRPLGLLPERRCGEDERYAGYFFPPVWPRYHTTTVAEKDAESFQSGRPDYNSDRQNAVNANMPGSSSFRHQPPRHVMSSYPDTEANNDGEYTDTLAQCRMQEYVAVSSEAKITSDVCAPSKTVQRRQRVQQPPLLRVRQEQR